MVAFSLRSNASAILARARERKFKGPGYEARERLTACAQFPAGPARERKALYALRMYLRGKPWPYRSDQLDATRARRAHAKLTQQLGLFKFKTSRRRSMIRARLCLEFALLERTLYTIVAVRIILVRILYQLYILCSSIRYLFSNNYLDTILYSYSLD